MTSDKTRDKKIIRVPFFSAPKEKDGKAYAVFHPQCVVRFKHILAESDVYELTEARAVAPDEAARFEIDRKSFRYLDFGACPLTTHDTRVQISAIVDVLDVGAPRPNYHAPSDAPETVSRRPISGTLEFEQEAAPFVLNDGNARGTTVMQWEPFAYAPGAKLLRFAGFDLRTRGGSLRSLLVSDVRVGRLSQLVSAGAIPATVAFLPHALAGLDTLCPGILFTIALSYSGDEPMQISGDLLFEEVPVPAAAPLDPCLESLRGMAEGLDLAVESCGSTPMRHLTHPGAPEVPYTPLSRRRHP